MRSIALISLVSIGIWTAGEISGSQPAGPAGPATVVPHAPGWELSGATPALQPCNFNVIGGGHASPGVIDIAPDCASRHGLDEARVWMTDDRGNIRIENQEGALLAEFVTGEFNGFISVYPQHALLTLTRK